jgi:hypothetical protein
VATSTITIFPSFGVSGHPPPPPMAKLLPSGEKARQVTRRSGTCIGVGSATGASVGAARAGHNSEYPRHTRLAHTWHTPATNLANKRVLMTCFLAIELGQNVP